MGGNSARRYFAPYVDIANLRVKAKLTRDADLACLQLTAMQAAKRGIEDLGDFDDIVEEADVVERMFLKEFARYGLHQGKRIRDLQLRFYVRVSARSFVGTQLVTPCFR